MPYAEDGETWESDYRAYFDGMAENKPGHKPFADYKLPFWAKHPLTHPSSGIFMDVDRFAYSCGDGLSNNLGWSPAHIAAVYGDMEMLESCTDVELNAKNIYGKTAAHYAVESGCSWAIQWLVEHGADTTSQAKMPNNQFYSPEEIIWVNTKNHNNEMEFLDQALKGELTEKKSVQHQEYKLKKWRPDGIDDGLHEYFDQIKLKQRGYMYKTGDFAMPYEIPTIEEVRLRGDLPSSKVRRPPEKAKPALPAALLFPGQGSQYVGMLKECCDLPAVKEMLDKAKTILGWDVKELCLNGPENKLSETKHCQPVMFIAGLAAMEVMKDTGKEDVVERPQATAGLSLGEYTALAAAGVLSFEDGLTLVNLRATAMQKATEAVAQCMCSVAGLDRSTLDKLCKEAKAEDKDTPDPVCQVANVLFPAGFTVAGTKKTMDMLCKKATAARALQARVIKAGGAFHTPLMAPATEELSKAIDDMLPKMEPPRCAVYFNITGKKISAGTDPKDFVDLMKKQLVSEVQWEPTIKQMIMDGVKDFYEVGPLKQIKSMIKRIDQDAFKRTENIPV
eukprot:gnl/TRDRNA2_/TRDRNA2_180508_c0_seq1.p1 gnl/TRDRNA2_/TRDRNA2_180508_c0~~gnl/TRDRNA2_/TRDRNA2_180508_c0_seq1.p1  ORF type:complete len:562 (+),score=155.56 gnl/TRDRNA2_/TRDRNA2_180508_c0_seq1:86-1771(+)